MNSLPSQLIAFDITVRLILNKISIPDANQAMHLCDEKQFYLAIPDIARFLALPEKKCIVIEKATEEVSIHILNTWLLGTMMAYMLQYHDYLVLHGSAVLINNKAVIFSGQSGAGKSTLASALVQKGYPFITDDLVVIKRNHEGQYCILPGPSKLKLWKDAMQHFNHDINDAVPVMLKTDKYAIQVKETCNEPMIPISAFYELNVVSQTDVFNCTKLDKAESLKTLMQNAYRYFMLKPLGKLQTFFQDCNGLSQQITVNKITRTTRFEELPQIIHQIELDLGIAS